MRDVSDIIEQRPAKVTKEKSATARPASTAGRQQSPTGPPVLAPNATSRTPATPSPPAEAARAKLTQEERLERIRRGARPISTPSAQAASGSRTATAPFDAKSIRDRLISGVPSLGGGSGTGGGRGGGSGGGDGDGSGGSGRGSGGGDGDGRGGSGNGSGGGHGDGSGPGSGPGDPFYTAIGTALYDAWAPPSRAEVGRGNPSVGVRITVRADGTVTAFQVSQASGNAAMNQSVEVLLRSLRRLPAPASFGLTEAVKIIEVRFTLESVERG